MFVLAATSGCGRATSSHEQPAASSFAPPPADSAPAPATSTAAPATFRLHRIATASEPVHAFDVRGGALLGSGAFLARLDAAGISQDPALVSGLEGDFEIASATGDFPEAAWLTVAIWSRTTGQISARRTYRWRANRWSAAPSPTHDTPPLGLVEIGQGRTAALFGEPDGSLSVRIVRAMKHLEVPAFPAGCPSAIRAAGARLAATADGTIHVIGQACAGGLADATWRAGAPAWTLTDLPAGKTPIAVSARGRDVWVGGTAAYLARHDGAAWARVDAPVTGAIVGLSVAEDGILFAATEDAVVRRDATGTYSRGVTEGEPLAAVTSVVALPGGRAFVATGGTSSGLWSTDPREHVLAVPDRRAMWATHGLTGHSVATDACAAYWVPLSTIGKSGGYSPRDLPWLREGARGHTEIATAAFVLDDDAGSLTLGAVVPTIEVGEKVLALFADRLGIAGARVACHAPRVVRRYPLDG